MLNSYVVDAVPTSGFYALRFGLISLLLQPAFEAVTVRLWQQILRCA